MPIIASEINQLKLHQTSPIVSELLLCDRHEGKIKNLVNSDLQALLLNKTFNQKICTALNLQGSEQLTLNLFVNKNRIEVSAEDKISKAPFGSKQIIQVTEQELLTLQGQLLDKANALWQKYHSKKAACCQAKKPPMNNPSSLSQEEKVDKVVFDTQLPGNLKEESPPLDFGAPATIQETDQPEVKKCFSLFKLADQIEQSSELGCPEALNQEFIKLSLKERKEVFEHLYLLQGAPSKSDINHGELAFYNRHGHRAANIERAQAIRCFALSQVKAKLYDESVSQKEGFIRSLNALPPEIKHALSEIAHELDSSMPKSRKIATAIDNYLKILKEQAQDALKKQELRTQLTKQILALEELKKIEEQKKKEQVN